MIHTILLVHVVFLPCGFFQLELVEGNALVGVGGSNHPSHVVHVATVHLRVSACANRRYDATSVVQGGPVTILQNLRVYKQLPSCIATHIRNFDNNPQKLVITDEELKTLFAPQSIVLLCHRDWLHENRRRLLSLTSDHTALFNQLVFPTSGGRVLHCLLDSFIQIHRVEVELVFLLL